MNMMTIKKTVPKVVEKKFYEVKDFADSEITMSKGFFALGLLAAALGGMLIGMLISPKGSKVVNVRNSDKHGDAIDDFNDFWFDEDEDDFTDEDADELTESNELNGNRSKFIKL